MAYYSLPLERNNVKDIPSKNCYITLCPYPDNYLKPEKGKKMTKEDVNTKKKCIANHNETIKQLDTGTFNMYNNSIDADDVLNSTYVGLIKDFGNNTVYKIKPILSREDRSGYDSRTRYKISEFNVVKKITNRKELLAQLAEDYLLDDFSAEVFNNYCCYGNEGYSDLLHDYFVEIKSDYPDVKIGLKDIVLTDDYHHDTSERFRVDRIYDLTKQNLRILLDENLISYITKYEYYFAQVITALVNCGLSDIAVVYLNEIPKDKYENISKDKSLCTAIKLHSTDEFVKDIMTTLAIELNEVILTIEESRSYGNDKVTEVKFNNINEVKSYLIKTYDVPFEKVNTNNISEIGFRNSDDVYYTFKIS